MDIPANCDRSLYWLDVAFFNKDLLNLFTENSKVSFREDTSVFHCLEPRVNVGLGTHLFQWDFEFPNINYNSNCMIFVYSHNFLKWGFGVLLGRWEP